MFGATQIQTRARVNATRNKSNNASAENDENTTIRGGVGGVAAKSSIAAATTKMVTSSKALASLKASTMGGSGAIIANVLATKGGVSNTTAANAAAVNTRKRAALGDLSNIQVQANAATTKVSKQAAGRKIITARKVSGPAKAAAVAAVVNQQEKEIEAKAAAAKEIKKTAPVTAAVAAQVVRATRSAKAAAASTSNNNTATTTTSTIATTSSKIDDTKSNENNTNTINTTTTTSSSISTTTTKSAITTTTAAKDGTATVVVLNSKKEVHVAKKSKVQGWTDLDADDFCDPLMVSEYVVEIMEYMRELELKTKPNPNYMEIQTDLKWKMRQILVDWLIEVHGKFRLLPETLYLAINILDRFLSLRVVSLVKLQLVGVTAMFIASKYEEIIHPSIANFSYMSDGGYTDEEVLKAERYVLSVISFDLQYPNPMNFLRRCSKAENYDIQTRTLAKYLMEVSLMDHRFLVYVPSIIAAAALYLARKMLGRGSWDVDLIHYSDYTEAEILPVVDLTLDYLCRPTKHEALFKKYSSKRFMKASIFVRDWVRKYAKDRVEALAGENSDCESDAENDDEDEDNHAQTCNLFGNSESGGDCEEEEEEEEEANGGEYSSDL